MNYYDELKSQTDILEVARELGFQARKEGSIAQGECPRHSSSKGSCLTLYANTQSFYCFHCNKGGDVINLVELFQDCEHRQAVDFLADFVGMPRLAASNLSPEEKAKLEADFREAQLVYEMLTEAARWYYRQLNTYPEIKGHLLNHYKFSEKIVDELKIGFAPPTEQGQESSLANHLQTFSKFKGKLHLTGLFNFVNPRTGPFYDYFQGRIMFPYWRHGKVVYFKGRATQFTPDNQYECYSLGDGEHPADYIKYKALRAHDPKDEKRKHISEVIKGDVFLGQVGGSSKKLLITEGVPDWVSAIDHGFQAISPGATNFKKDALDKLAHLLRDKSVYLIFDNDANEAGQDAALNLGELLLERGILAYLVDLPKQSGVDKIDLNEYLRDHSAAELSGLMEKAKLVVHRYMEKLPADQFQALEDIKSVIFPLLVHMKSHQVSLIIEELVKKTKISKSILKEGIDHEIKLSKEKKSKKIKPLDPEIIKQAQAIAQDPLLFKKRLDVVNQFGVVGERNVIAMYFAALDSRLLPGDNGDINTLAVKNQGHFGSGKSFALGKTLEIYPESCYHMITNGSAKSLYYLPEGLSYKALVVAEGFQFQSNNAADSELAYIVRSLISEGRIRYMVPQKDSSGNMITVEKKLDGPTSFITTTVMEKLEPQLEDRLFTVHPNESPEHTRNIVKASAAKAAGDISSVDERTIAVWKEYHRSLKPVKIIIPYAQEIAKFILGDNVMPLAVRRAFNRVISVIKAVTCAYQHQRQLKDDKIVAEVQDYYMALQIVGQAFKESLGQMSEITETRLSFFAQKSPVTQKMFVEKFKISKSAASQWIKKQVEDGTLRWCKQNGQAFADDKEIKTAKSSGKAFIKMADSITEDDFLGLPTPYDLTQDDDWATGGRLYKEYDLELGKPSKAETDSAEDETEVEDGNGVGNAGSGQLQKLPSFMLPRAADKSVAEETSADDDLWPNDDWSEDPGLVVDNDDQDKWSVI